VPVRSKPHSGKTFSSTTTVGQELIPVHKVTFVVGSVPQLVPLAVALKVPLSPVTVGTLEAPASLLDVGSVQPEKEDNPTEPKKHKTLAENQRGMIAFTSTLIAREGQLFEG
jgi:hypothetical protein